jgi:hypothetical protein
MYIRIKVSTQLVQKFLKAAKEQKKLDKLMSKYEKRADKIIAKKTKPTARQLDFLNKYKLIVSANSKLLSLVNKMVQEDIKKDVLSGYVDFMRSIFKKI